MDSPAVGKLESIRALLNTWHVPNDTRRPVDDLPGLLTDRTAWEAQMADLRFPGRDADRREIGPLRDELRASLSGQEAAGLDELVSARRWRLGVGPAADAGAETAADGETATGAEPDAVTDAFTLRWSVDPPGTAGDALAIVVGAVANRTWSRLRACPDCHWVFYDTSRNGRRTWCSMTAAAGARGCGSIAKTRAYRQRRRGGP